MSSIYNITKKYLDDARYYNKEMILTDFLFLLVTGLVSLYPVNRLLSIEIERRNYSKKK